MQTILMTRIRSLLIWWNELITEQPESLD